MERKRQEDMARRESEKVLAIMGELAQCTLTLFDAWEVLKRTADAELAKQQAVIANKGGKARAKIGFSMLGSKR